ncbi:hypothetical protein ABIE78_001660 [Sinorhizobium fredii]|uniref:site-specific DNA-methyltransferase (adenine-specific) n=1 Tax=Sinorhizobium fredii (strain USDA 257) TaxID=1185652 RepID=I3X9A2_SINF2|nr:DNA methyltransferase [Sinorhizobium fredii]AFL52458.1 DNA methylase N-4/N-6 domain-containing protein [Sinorhizobium fredii USDA 257]
MNKTIDWTPSVPEGRWATLGPYYAMFPTDFVREAVARFSRPGDGVLDPFCGRGTVPFVAASTGRFAVGVDVNPVAWVFASAKTSPEPDVQKLVRRIHEIAALVAPEDRHPENEFQAWAWDAGMLGFLRAARRELRWRADRTDWTLAAIILVHLHGKAGTAVSNQMRQSKAMSPDYSVRWWKAREMRPPEIDPVTYFEARVAWRYTKGLPRMREWSEIELGDARDRLVSWKGSAFRLLLTSPPYCGVTNYRLDNWIRLWLLGDSPLPNGSTAQKYADREGYRRLLMEAFSTARNAMSPHSVILVRTDSRVFTRDATAATLRCLWPSHRMLARSEKPVRSQTQLFGDKSEKPGETDILMLPPLDRRRPQGYRSVPDAAMTSVQPWLEAFPDRQPAANRSVRSVS